MTEPTEDDVLDAMAFYGGSFVRTLADLYRRGDPINRAKLRRTFDDYFAEYADAARLRAANDRAREKHEDDGQEYADPRDYRAGLE